VCCKTVVACVEPGVCDCLFSGFVFVVFLWIWRYAAVSCWVGRRLPGRICFVFFVLWVSWLFQSQGLCVCFVVWLLLCQQVSCFFAVRKVFRWIFAIIGSHNGDDAN
jgi:hypothetical protein